MNKVLIITYYWPPAPGAGAQRIYSFAKYLPEFGFLPYVLTPDTTVPPAPLPVGQCITIKGWDPARSRNHANRKPAGVTTPTANKKAEWIRLNVFIPDTKIAWFMPAYKKARAIIEAEKPDLIFTSAPPYTIHLVGKALHKKYGIPWIADFRDPWIENHAYNTAHRMALPLWINQKMERSVLLHATHITTALDSQRQLLAGKVNRSDKVFTTINNGFEHSAWDHVDKLQTTETLYISHFGTIYQDGLDLDLLSAITTTLRNITIDDSTFSMRLFGNIPNSVIAMLKNHLSPDQLQVSTPVPHEAVEEMLQQQQLLLLIVNHGSTHAYSHPSKVFEYMASGNPILAIGPENHEVMRILREHAPKRSYLCQDANHVRTAMETIATQWKQGTMPVTPLATGPFSRKALTDKLSKIFQNV